jgi:hypothetical protein
MCVRQRGAGSCVLVKGGTNLLRVKGSFCFFSLKSELMNVSICLVKCDVCFRSKEGDGVGIFFSLIVSIAILFF